jgi:hypothetical protein
MCRLDRWPVGESSCDGDESIVADFRFFPPFGSLSVQAKNVTLLFIL